LISRLSGGDQKLTSTPTTNGGTTMIEYKFSDSLAHASRLVEVRVLRGPNQPVAASIVWTISPAPPAPAMASGEWTVDAAGSEFPVPLTPSPGQYKLDLIVRSRAVPPVALDQHSVAFNFKRNGRFDAVLRGDGVLGPTRVATLRLDDYGKTGFEDLESRDVARAVLRHPMVAGQGAKGSVVEREELIRILLELAANEGCGASKMKAELRSKLQRVLARNGIPNPSATLAAIRKNCQEEEKNDHRPAAHVRQTKAILEAATSDFVGKIHAWFDQCMQRVTHRYALWARVITVVGALLVAFTMQLDSLQLLKRLSTDDKFRGSLLAEAEAQQKRIDALTPTTTTTDTKGADTKGAEAKGTTDTKGAETKGTHKVESKQAGLPGATGGTMADSLQAELKLAKEKREEIEQNLSKLRDPQLAILPGYFPWDRQREARTTKQPAAREYELVLGDNTYKFTLSGGPATLDGLRDAIDQLGVRVKTRVDNDAVVLTSRQPETFELLSKPGHRETNILGTPNSVGGWQFMQEGQSLRGILLSWVLLSLGAPFWYDALKDLLKLRPALAKNEEQQRTDRQKDTGGAGKKGSTGETSKADHAA
jgi:hypothetical protein